MTNHVTEALGMLPASEVAGEYPAEGRIALAQVHATLALVEQQRAANLLALMSAPRNTTLNGWQDAPDVREAQRIIRQASMDAGKES